MELQAGVWGSLARTCTVVLPRSTGEGDSNRQRSRTSACFHGRAGMWGGEGVGTVGGFGIYTVDGRVPALGLGTPSWFNTVSANECLREASGACELLNMAGCVLE